MKNNTLLIILGAAAVLYYLQMQKQQNELEAKQPSALQPQYSDNDLIANIGSPSRILRRVNKTV